MTKEALTHLVSVAGVVIDAGGRILCAVRVRDAFSPTAASRTHNGVNVINPA